MIWELLKRLLPHRELGWSEIDEEFTRFIIVRSKRFQVFLHRLRGERWHDRAHDHPWDYVTIILRGGYVERTPAGDRWIAPGTVLFRSAEFAHNVVTRNGDVCWSLVFTGAKKREWGFVEESP